MGREGVQNSYILDSCVCGSAGGRERVQILDSCMKDVYRREGGGSDIRQLYVPCLQEGRREFRY